MLTPMIQEVILALALLGLTLAETTDTALGLRLQLLRKRMACGTSQRQEIYALVQHQIHGVLLQSLGIQ
jgi:hypothetical protein